MKQSDFVALLQNKHLYFHEILFVSYVWLSLIWSYCRFYLVLSLSLYLRVSVPVVLFFISPRSEWCHALLKLLLLVLLFPSDSEWILLCMLFWLSRKFQNIRICLHYYLLWLHIFIYLFSVGFVVVVVNIWNQPANIMIWRCALCWWNGRNKTQFNI